MRLEPSQHEIPWWLNVFLRLVTHAVVLVLDTIDTQLYVSILTWSWALLFEEGQGALSGYH
jgi:hypothetical protein